MRFMSHDRSVFATRPLFFTLLLLPLISACDPFADWPQPESYFPYVYTPVEGLLDYEDVRWETESWDTSDSEMTGLYVLKALNHRVSAPVEELQHFEQIRPRIPPLGSGVRLSFVGDIMYIGGRENWTSYALPAGILLDGDYRIGNLETPTSPAHSIEPRALGLYAFNAPPRMLDGLPLDLLQLNNNHSLDAGDEGLENTINELEFRGFEHTGVDAQIQVELMDGQTNTHQVAFVSYTWGLNDARRSQNGHELHIVPFGHIDEEISLELIGAQINQARAAGAETVVALLHWGFEYEYYPDPHFMVLARRIIALGADLIVGQGPHVAQPPEICSVNNPERVPGIGACSLTTEDGRQRTAAVLYSLGNFGTEMPTIPAQVGLVATVSLDPDVTGFGWQGVASIMSNGEPSVVPLDDLRDRMEYAEERERLREHLGTTWAR